MLTADAFGILPPIARLTHAQALFYFLSGFTAKLAGTEIGVTEPQPTFSTCFGAPFLPAAAGSLRADARREARRARRRRPGSSTRAGPAARSARASGCRSRRRARCCTPRCRASSTASTTAWTTCSASRCRRRSRASTATLLDPRGTWRDPDAYDVQGARARADVPRELREVRGRSAAEVCGGRPARLAAGEARTPRLR